MVVYQCFAADSALQLSFSADFAESHFVSRIRRKGADPLVRLIPEIPAGIEQVGVVADERHSDGLLSIKTL